MDEADQSEHHKTTGNEYYRLNAQLIEHLNGNIHYQLFCGVQIDPLHPLTNPKIVSAIRQELADRLDVESLQLILAAVSYTHLCVKMTKIVIC